MKTIFKILTISLVLSSCFNSGWYTKAEAIVTNKENLDQYVGKLITIKGKIVYKHIPTIIGVEVSCKNAYKIDENLNGRIGTANGILTKIIVTEIDSVTQNRGVGTFYRLKYENSNRNSEVTLSLRE